MLIGQYNYAIDEKGRLNFPPRFREEMGDAFVVTRWIEDGCLVAFSQAQWARMSEKLMEKGTVQARDAQLNLYAFAAPAQPDKQGRILLPGNLREIAGLEKDVTVVGVGTHAEIWDSEAWRARSARLSAKTLAHTLEELEL